MVFRKLTLLTLFLSSFHMSADVATSGIFSDNAVLQRNAPIAIFGTATPGEPVKISLNNAEVSTTGGEDGRFLAYLPAMKEGGPFELQISGRNNTLTFKNIMLGEVWLCSGQSNMWWPVRLNTNATEHLENCENNDIRLFRVNQVFATTPKRSTPHTWNMCNKQNLADFSAVGYFFAKRLNEQLNVPVGVLDVSWSGTSIEPWIAPIAFLNSNDKKWNTKKELLLARETGGNFQTKLLNEHVAAQKKWQIEALQAVKDKVAIPTPPSYPWQLSAPLGLGDPSVIWNGMVAPLTPFTLAGVIWYQGEGNLWDAAIYGDLMELWVEGWRKEFKNSKLPFYFVQLAPYNSQSEFDVLPKMWECQANFADEHENVEMVEINDTDSVGDIHPPEKQPAANRMANKALKYVYAQNTGNVDSPKLHEYHFSGNTAELTFKNTDNLTVINGTAIFELANAAGVWKPASMKIEGNTITLYSSEIEVPCMVRYNWNKIATASIADSQTLLPLGAFRVGTLPERGMSTEFAPQLNEYELIYRFTPGKTIMSGDNKYVNYDIAKAPQKPFTRMAIFAHLLNKDGSSQFVCVEMDAYSSDSSKLGLPTADSGAAFSTKIKNVSVSSNVPGVKNGTFAEGCNIEFFPSNYTPPNTANVPGASAIAFDFGDDSANNGAGYGSYQIHNFAAKQTIFAFNAWQNGATADLGIGSNPSGNSDWTFARNADTYSTAYILVFVK